MSLPRRLRAQCGLTSLGYMVGDFGPLPLFPRGRLHDRDRPEDSESSHPCWRASNGSTRRHRCPPQVDPHARGTANPGSSPHAAPRIPVQTPVQAHLASQSQISCADVALTCNDLSMCVCPCLKPLPATQATSKEDRRKGKDLFFFYFFFLFFLLLFGPFLLPPCLSCAILAWDTDRHTGTLNGLGTPIVSSGSPEDAHYM